MGPLFVVLLHPLRTDLAHLIQRLKYLGVEYLMPDGAIEPFNVGVLIGLTGLNMPECNTPLCTPHSCACCEEFWPVVYAEARP